MQITTEHIKAIFPKYKYPDDLADALTESFDKYEINTVNRAAGFLAQCGHESVGFTVLKENLNYSAEGLNKTFKKYFPTVESAQPYARNPEKIANKVYANRMSNGDEASGDGYRFRGRGAIQLTGRDNYSQFAKAVGLTLEEANEQLTNAGVDVGALFRERLPDGGHKLIQSIKSLEARLCPPKADAATPGSAPTRAAEPVIQDVGAIYEVPPSRTCAPCQRRRAISLSPALRRQVLERLRELSIEAKAAAPERASRPARE